MKNEFEKRKVSKFNIREALSLFRSDLYYFISCKDFIFQYIAVTLIFIVYFNALLN